MNLNKLKTQNPDIVKKNQPDLYKNLKKVFPDASPEEFGKIAGLIIEYVIQSQGNVEIFQDNDVLLPNVQFDDDF